MAGEMRTTVYLRPQVYRALKIKAATTDRSLSELINSAVLEALREDALDLGAFGKRAKERSRPLEKVLADLNRDKYPEDQGVAPTLLYFPRHAPPHRLSPIPPASAGKVFFS